MKNLTVILLLFFSFQLSAQELAKFNVQIEDERIDAPVSICMLKRFAGDVGEQKPDIISASAGMNDLVKEGMKVAVIGAGLAAGYVAANIGDKLGKEAATEIYDANSEANWF